jgi:hypothetical protein
LLIVGRSEEFGHCVAGPGTRFDDEAVSVDAEADGFAYAEVKQIEDGRGNG